VLGVFYTPGWGAVLTVTGTLGGVIVTQIANSWSTRGARRKERNDRINDAVGDLIACGNEWVYVVNAYEEKMFETVILRADGDEQGAALTAGRAGMRSAELAYGRAQARVRLACPLSIVDSAEDYRKPLQAFEDAVEANVGVLLQNQRTYGVERTRPNGVAVPQDRLVNATRAETGGAR
jgi:hypothetical protein